MENKDCFYITFTKINRFGEKDFKIINAFGSEKEAQTYFEQNKLELKSKNGVQYEILKSIQDNNEKMN